MSINENQGQPKNKDFYDGTWHLTINKQVIEVTEEVYRAYKQPLWAEKKRQEREKRCIVSDGCFLQVLFPHFCKTHFLFPDWGILVIAGQAMWVI